MANHYQSLDELWHAWFGVGWPDAEDMPALEEDIRALMESQKPKPTARPPHPATMIGRGNRAVCLLDADRIAGVDHDGECIQ